MLPTTKPGDGDDFAMLRFGVAVTVLVLDAQTFAVVQLAPGVGADAPPVASTDA